MQKIKIVSRNRGQCPSTVHNALSLMGISRKSVIDSGGTPWFSSGGWDFRLDVVESRPVPVRFCVVYQRLWVTPYQIRRVVGRFKKTPDLSLSRDGFLEYYRKMVVDKGHSLSDGWDGSLIMDPVAYCDRVEAP